MFDSLDILYIVVAFCILWLTAFVCWLIWQVAMMLKNVNDTLAEAREKLAMIEEAITGIRRKFDKATSGVGLLVDGVKRMIEYALERKTDVKTKKKKITKEDEE